ncbi:MAG: hypothetical protein J6X44_10340, partial [Thermoguttaceae bacterium]|nr:hypothetical protein [Thermoguttaceae bacterium]
RSNSFLKTDIFIILFQRRKLLADVGSLSTERFLSNCTASILRGQVLFVFSGLYTSETLIRRKDKQKLGDDLKKRIAGRNKKTPKENPWGKDVNIQCKTAI